MSLSSVLRTVTSPICGKVAKGYSKSHHLANGGASTCAGKMNHISNVMLIALVVIGALAATGMMSTAAAAWSAVGLGGGVMITQLLGGNLKKRVPDLILTAVLSAGIITVGALGGTGILSGPYLGYSLIGIVGVNAIFWGCGGRAYTACQLSNAERKGKDKKSQSTGW